MILEPPKHVGQRRRIECTSESQVPFTATCEGIAFKFSEVGQFIDLQGRRTSPERDAPLLWKLVRIGRSGHARGGIA